MYLFKTVLITKWEGAVNLDNRRQYNGRVLSTKTTRNSKIGKCCQLGQIIDRRMGNYCQNHRP